MVLRCSDTPSLPVMIFLLGYRDMVIAQVIPTRRDAPEPFVN
jgi:hypothetical protein